MAENIARSFNDVSPISPESNTVVLSLVDIIPATVHRYFK